MSGAAIAPPLVSSAREWADARTAPSWRPQDGSAYHLHTYDPYDVVQVWMRIDGTFRTGLLYQHADWGQPARRLIRPFFAPALRSGERDRWVWWQPDRMYLTGRSETSTIEAAGPSEGDAVRCGRRRGELSATSTMLPRRIPGEIRVGGAWRTAQIFSRVDWSDGAVGCLAHVFLPEKAWGAHVSYVRAYMWDPRTVRPAAPNP